MIGYAIAGRCTPDQATALFAFNSMFPRVEGGYIQSLQSSSFVGANTLGFTLHTVSIPDSKFKAIYTEVLIPSCDPANDPNYFLQPTPADIFFVFTWGMGAVLLMFFFGFVISAAVSVIRKL